MNDDEVREYINLFLEKTLSIIKLVEEQLLSHSEELLRMKETK
jgi:hypothetical protein